MADSDNAITFSTIATIVYFSSYAILVVALSIFVHCTESYDNKKDFLTAIWSRRGIYGQILAHLYDTATDIGVLFEWYILAYDSYDYKSIDMHVMFWTSIGFLIFYRVLSAFIALFQTHDKSSPEPHEYMLDFCLGIFDMHIIKTVYVSLVTGHQEPSPQQKVAQLLESICESLPQVF